MHRDAFAACDVTDDHLALDRVAALGAVNHHVVDAMDGDGVTGIGLLLPGLLLGRFDGWRRWFFDNLFWRGFLEHLAGGKLAIA